MTITAVLSAFISSILFIRCVSRSSYPMASDSYRRPQIWRILAVVSLPPLAALILFSATLLNDNATHAILVFVPAIFVVWLCIEIIRYDIRLLSDGMQIQHAFHRRFVKFEKVAGYYKDSGKIVLILSPKQKLLINRPILGFSVVLALRCSRRITLRLPLTEFNDLHSRLIRARFLDSDETVWSK